MLELYNFSQSTCSQKVRICLHEKKLKWIDKRLFSSDQEHLKDWYIKINPNGVVPTLIHNKKAIYESSVILEYLDDVFPKHSLSPIRAFEKSQMRSTIIFIDSILTPAIRYPSFQFGGLLKKFKKLTIKEFNSKISLRPTKENFYNKMNKNSGFSDDILFNSYKDIIKCSKRLDSLLKNSKGPWFMGKKFSLADIVAGPLYDRLEDLGLEELWEDNYKSLSVWLKTLQKRESFIKTFYNESRLSEQHKDIKLGRGSRSELIKKFKLNI